MKKSFTIKNKKGFTIHGVIEYYGKKYGPVVLVCHGYKGFINQLQIKETANALAKEGFTAVRFDATNSTGKSQGPLVDFTVGGYIIDIKSVIDFILKKTKQDRVIFFGFSIAAMAGYIIASTNRKIKAQIMQGPPFDLSKGRISQVQKQMREKGYAVVYARSLKRNVRMGEKVLRQGLRYDVNKYLKKLSCPTLVLIGSKEERWNKELIKSGYKTIKTKNKKLAIIKGAHHTMRTKKELKPFIKEFITWLKENNL